MQGFAIHALRLGGGTLALAPLPGAAGDYAGDMTHLLAWQPALVISMTVQAEMATVGAGDLGVQVQASGARWIGLPVADYGVPDTAQAEVWARASAGARAALAGGGRVLVQCRGGCGRSGMAALRLMIEAGEDGQAALARLRGLRPCAVETGAQMAWAMRGADERKPG